MSSLLLDHEKIGFFGCSLGLGGKQCDACSIDVGGLRPRTESAKMQSCLMQASSSPDLELDHWAFVVDCTLCLLEIDFRFNLFGVSGENLILEWKEGSCRAA